MKELSKTLTRNCVVEKYGVIITDYLMNVFECAVFMSSTRHNVFVDDDYDEDYDDDDDVNDNEDEGISYGGKAPRRFIFDRHAHTQPHI